MAQQAHHVELDEGGAAMAQHVELDEGDAATPEVHVAATPEVHVAAAVEVASPTAEVPTSTGEGAAPSF